MTAAIHRQIPSASARSGRLDRAMTFAPAVNIRGQYISTGRPSPKQEGRLLAAYFGLRESTGELAPALSLTQPPRSSEN